MKAVLTIIASYAICVPIHVLGLVIVNWFVGAKIQGISIYIEPNIKKFKLYDTVVDLNLLPLGGSVKFTEDIFMLNPLKRAVGSSGGIIALFILSGVLLGFPVAYDKFFITFSQVFYGTLWPSTIGANLADTAYRYFSARPFGECVGWIAIKYAAIDLLPLFVFNGGHIVVNLLSLVRPVPLKFRERLQQISFLIVLVILCCWIYAVYVFQKG